MSREEDAIVDKLVFGRDRYAELLQHGGILLPVEAQIPEYTTDAAADYEVLKRVRASFNGLQQMIYARELHRIQWMRKDAPLTELEKKSYVRYYNDNCLHYEAGDYSSAALRTMADDNFK